MSVIEMVKFSAIANILCVCGLWWMILMLRQRIEALEKEREL